MASTGKVKEMFDYLKIEKYLTTGENIFFENLQWKGTYADGTEWFFISNGFKPLKVLWSKIMSRLTIVGSFPFFWQGHNFTFSMQTFYDAVESIATKIGVNLLDADILQFEYGRIVEVERPPNEILSKHRSLQGFKRIEHDRGIYFEDKILRVKLYDAGHRIKMVSRPCINTLKNDLGFKSDTNYIRVENHYKKPQIHFKERNIKLETLFSESFQTILKKDLLETYKAIEKMKPLGIPTDKKLITSSRNFQKGMALMLNTKLVIL
jgi:hypothetical protein